MTDTEQTVQPEDTAGLIRQYDRETDPAKKKELLARMDANDERVKARNELFNRRFSVTKEGNYADRFLFVFMQILQTRNVARGLFGFNRKQMLKELSVFGYREAGTCTEAEQDALHREIVNAALRYFETCKSPEYRRKLFGTMTPSDEERRVHIRNDAYAISYGLASRMDLEKETAFLCRAVSEAYAIFAPEEPVLSANNIS